MLKDSSFFGEIYWSFPSKKIVPKNYEKDPATLMGSIKVGSSHLFYPHNKIFL